MEVLSPGLMYALAIAAMIAGVLTGAWWIVSLYWLHSRETEDALPKVGLPDDIEEVLIGVPPTMVFFYIFIGLSLVFYVIFIWLGGQSY